jgi:hypothetical protein
VTQSPKLSVTYFPPPPSTPHPHAKVETGKGVL